MSSKTTDEAIWVKFPKIFSWLVSLVTISVLGLMFVTIDSRIKINDSEILMDFLFFFYFPRTYFGQLNFNFAWFFFLLNLHLLGKTLVSFYFKIEKLHQHFSFLFF